MTTATAATTAVDTRETTIHVGYAERPQTVTIPLAAPRDWRQPGPSSLTPDEVYAWPVVVATVRQDSRTTHLTLVVDAAAGRAASVLAGDRLRQAAIVTRLDDPDDLVVVVRSAGGAWAALLPFDSLDVTGGRDIDVHVHDVGPGLAGRRGSDRIAAALVISHCLDACDAGYQDTVRADLVGAGVLTFCVHPQ